MRSLKRIRGGSDFQHSIIRDACNPNLLPKSYPNDPIEKVLERCTKRYRDSLKEKEGLIVPTKEEEI